MCIGFWSLLHPDYSLVLCTNRDEYPLVLRPTVPAHWHSFILGDTPIEEQNDGFVLSGIDKLGSGTWLGVNKHGDASFLTNVSEPDTEPMTSRGHLCSSFLLRNKSTAQTSTLTQFVERLTTSGTRYAGFNMLLLAAKGGCHDNEHAVEYAAAMLSNGGAGQTICSIPVAEKFGVISNDSLTGVDPFTGLNSDTVWPKVALGRELFQNIISQSKCETEDIFIERLFEMLREKRYSPPGARQTFQETIMVDAVDMQNGPWFAQTPRISKDSRQEGETFRGGAIRFPLASPTHHLFTIDNISEQATPKYYYATRLSSVLLIRKDGSAMFIERDIWICDKDDEPILIKEEHKECHERKYSFRVS